MPQEYLRNKSAANFVAVPSESLHHKTTSRSSHPALRHDVSHMYSQDNAKFINRAVSSPLPESMHVGPPSIRGPCPATPRRRLPKLILSLTILMMFNFTLWLFCLFVARSRTLSWDGLTGINFQLVRTFPLLICTCWIFVLSLLDIHFNHFRISALVVFPLLFIPTHLFRLEYCPQRPIWIQNSPVVIFSCIYFLCLLYGLSQLPSRGTGVINDRSLQQLLPDLVVDLFGSIMVVFLAHNTPKTRNAAVFGYIFEACIAIKVVIRSSICSPNQALPQLRDRIILILVWMSGLLLPLSFLWLPLNVCNQQLHPKSLEYIDQILRMAMSISLSLDHLAFWWFCSQISRKHSRSEQLRDF